MKLHLECERTIHFQKVDGTQGVLKEGAQAYMHFITSKKIDIWATRPWKSSFSRMTCQPESTVPMIFRRSEC